MTKTLKEKLDARASIYEKMQEYLAKHPDMTDEQLEEFSAMEKQYEDIDKAIDKLEAMAKRKEKLAAATTDPLTGSELGDAGNSDDAMQEFRAYLKGTGGIPSAKNAMTIGTDADGGYIVPESFQNTVVTKLNTLGRTRSISTVIQTDSTRNIPVEGDAPTFAWIDEGGTYGETKSTFGKVVIGAYKLGGIIKVSEELLQDNMINFDDYMTTQIAKGIDKAEAPAFCTGDGNSKPTGYVTGGTVGPNSTTAAQAAVTADEIIDIYYDLPEEYRANAKWRMNDKTEKAIRKLKDGNGAYIYSPALNDGERPTLLGKPIVIDNSMPDLAAGNKFIAIGDFSFYQIGDRGSMSIQRLNELYAGTGFVGFKVTKRIDAKLTLSEAVNVGQAAV